MKDDIFCDNIKHVNFEWDEKKSQVDCLDCGKIKAPFPYQVC